MKRYRLKQVVLVLAGLVLIYGLEVFSHKIGQAGSKFKMEEYNFYRMMSNIFLTLLGVLLEWRTLGEVSRTGVKIDFLGLAFAVILVAFPLIPYTTMMSIFGGHYLPVTPKSFLAIMHYAVYVRSALSVIGGALLVRSLNAKRKAAISEDY